MPLCVVSHLSAVSAKARQREKEASTVASSVRNANSKRPLSVVPAVSGSPTAPSKKAGSDHYKLQRDARLGKYFDYDLSKMVNSKGGFLVEDDKEVDDDQKAKERERERQRAMQNVDPRTFLPLCCLTAPLMQLATIAIYLDPSRNPKCHECQSMDIDQMYRKVFRCLVCKTCRNEKVEKYSLLTKTECKEVNSIHFYAYI
jgi:DNA-repair protein complementing XP-A cells